MKHRCPVCHKTIKASIQEQSKQATFFPFCSKRCKLIDLGAWLDSKYKIVSRSDSEESGEPSDTSSDRPSDEQ
ncbi:MAG: DNA gyrase inhibitor YacG [Planctomycetes bacterium]|nr:DNA gyrase inhibitor YacG [Planctomycetota bacterium]MCH8118652.1 DNA gyrase inhibitor YacG [Planctomycetota bacterium]